MEFYNSPNLSYNQRYPLLKPLFGTATPNANLKRNFSNFLSNENQALGSETDQLNLSRRKRQKTLKKRIKSTALILHPNRAYILPTDPYRNRRAFILPASSINLWSRLKPTEKVRGISEAELTKSDRKPRPFATKHYNDTTHEAPTGTAPTNTRQTSLSFYVKSSKKLFGDDYRTKDEDASPYTTTGHRNDTLHINTEQLGPGIFDASLLPSKSNALVRAKDLPRWHKEGILLESLLPYGIRFPDRRLRKALTLPPEDGRSQVTDAKRMPGSSQAALLQIRDIPYTIKHRHTTQVPEPTRPESPDFLDATKHIGHQSLEDLNKYMKGPPLEEVYPKATPTSSFSQKASSFLNSFTSTQRGKNLVQHIVTGDPIKPVSGWRRVYQNADPKDKRSVASRFRQAYKRADLHWKTRRSVDREAQRSAAEKLTPKKPMYILVNDPSSGSNSSSAFSSQEKLALPPAHQPLAITAPPEEPGGKVMVVQHRPRRN